MERLIEYRDCHKLSKTDTVATKNIFGPRNLLLSKYIKHFLIKSYQALIADRRKVSERLRIDGVQAIFAWPLVKHLQSRRYLSDPFLLQREGPSVGEAPAIRTLIADWWLSEIHQKILFL